MNCYLHADANQSDTQYGRAQFAEATAKATVKNCTPGCDNSACGESSAYGMILPLQERESSNRVRAAISIGMVVTSSVAQTIWSTPGALHGMAYLSQQHAEARVPNWKLTLMFHRSNDRSLLGSGLKHAAPKRYMIGLRPKPIS